MQGERSEGVIRSRVRGCTPMPLIAWAGARKRWMETAAKASGDPPSVFAGQTAFDSLALPSRSPSSCPASAVALIAIS
jgi:hypothetical protein